MTKYSHLELLFPNFLNKNLLFLPVNPVSLWHGKGFWPKDVLLTCLHAEVVECWGKVILLLLPCCLCICCIVLTKNACGARPPSSLQYDDAGRSSRKGGLFLMNVVGVDLVSLRRTSWYFCLVFGLIHQSSLKFYPNNSLWLSEKMPAFSFNICLDLCSFIKALRTDRRLLYVTLSNTCPNIIIDCSVSSLNWHKSISILSVLHWVESSIFCQFFDRGPRTFNSFCCIFCKSLSSCICEYLKFSLKSQLKNSSRGAGGGTLLVMGLCFRMLTSSWASGIKFGTHLKYAKAYPPKGSIHIVTASCKSEIFSGREIIPTTIVIFCINKGHRPLAIWERNGILACISIISSPVLFTVLSVAPTNSWSTWINDVLQKEDTESNHYQLMITGQKNIIIISCIFYALYNNLKSS